MTGSKKYLATEYVESKIEHVIDGQKVCFVFKDSRRRCFERKRRWRWIADLSAIRKEKGVDCRFRMFWFSNKQKEEKQEGCFVKMKTSGLKIQEEGGGRVEEEETILEEKTFGCFVKWKCRNSCC